MEKKKIERGMRKRKKKEICDTGKESDALMNTHRKDAQRDLLTEKNYTQRQISKTNFPSYNSLE